MEFYAPWCGHCQNLKPAYEKAAKNLDGLAKVAAVNCDEDENKPLCGRMGVQGFPTLKIVRPGGKSGKPVIEDYQGPRSAKGIVDVVVDKINNHVKRVTDKDIEDWLEKNNDTAKAILFTEKGTTSALLKSIAIDFLDVISVAQIRNKETKANSLFGIETYPTLLLLPGGDEEGVVFDGQMKKAEMVKFLSRAGTPNPDPAPRKPKGKDKPASSASSGPGSETASGESTTRDAPADAETPPIIIELAPPIPAITSSDKLAAECLNRKSSTCILAFVPSAHGKPAEVALTSLSEVAFKHSHGRRHLFPFFEIHAEDDKVASVAKALQLPGEIEIVAINGKRGWWRRYEGADFSQEGIESWIDAIRLSEGVKNKLPEGLIADVVEDKPAEETIDVKVEESIEIEIAPEADSTTSTHGTDPTPDPTETAEEREHDEL